VSLVSLNPPACGATDGVTSSSSVDGVPLAEKAFAATGCFIEDDDDARLTLTAFPAH